MSALMRGGIMRGGEGGESMEGGGKMLGFVGGFGAGRRRGEGGWCFWRRGSGGGRWGMGRGLG